jgi:uncharacterized iron-regulated membrane protein
VKPSILIRKLHYWSVAAIAIPASLLMGTGLLLQLKKQIRWVQPPEQRGTAKSPEISLDSALRSIAAYPETGVKSWDDVNRIDVRVQRGIAKFWLHSGYEAQVDLGTGKVLQHEYRRSDTIEAIHDGSWFAGDWTKLGVMLPTGAILFFMWMSGIWLFIVPFIAKRRRARLNRQAAIAATISG